MTKDPMTITVTLDDQTIDQIAELQHAVDRFERRDAAPSASAAAVLATACVAAGSMRKVSRRALFGLGRKAVR
jgi:hypothetical protein